MKLWFYYLDNKGKIHRTPEFQKALAVMEKYGQWKLEDSVGKVKVSTVFFPIDLNLFRQGAKPILFETMIYGGKHDGQSYRSATIKEAEAKHASILAKLQK